MAMLSADGAENTKEDGQHRASRLIFLQAPLLRAADEIGHVTLQRMYMTGAIC